MVDRRALTQGSDNASGSKSTRVRVCLEVDAAHLSSLLTQRICGYGFQNS